MHPHMRALGTCGARPPNEIKETTHARFCMTPLFSRYRRAYYAAISYTDYNIGVIVDSLDKLGLKEDTVVIVFGDHGYQVRATPPPPPPPHVRRQKRGMGSFFCVLRAPGTGCA